MSDNKRVCVVGACFTDLIAYCPRLPAPGETLVGSKFSTGFGGKGANQAVQAAKLGSDVVMISKVGDDGFGKDTLDNFKKQGVNADHVSVAAGTASGVAPIAVDTSTGENSIVIVPGAAALFSPEDIAAAEAIIKTCNVLVCQLEVPMETNLAALKAARAAGLTTILNTAPVPPGGRLPEEIWSLCDIVCPNETELQGLTDLPTGTDAEVQTAAEELLRRGAKRVLVTLGVRGCALFEACGAGRKFVPGVKVAAKDTSGAGDSFLGATVHYLMRGLKLEAAMEKANAVAAVSVQGEGTQKSFPTAEEMAKGRL